MSQRGRGRGRRHRGHRPVRHGDYAYVLDYLPTGMGRGRPGPRLQLLDEEYLVLLEAVPAPGFQPEVGERIYIGPGEEAKAVVEGELDYESLSSVAKGMLPSIVEEIVKSKEDVFVRFFNTAGPITLRFHSLELLPGVGKKTLKRILEAREREPFKSYEDIRERAHIDPVKALTERIVEELKGGQKYYLFVRPPRREMEAVVPPVFLNYLGLGQRRERRAGRRIRHGEEGTGA